MTKMSRITLSLSDQDQAVLKKKIKAMDLASPGQLLRMLLSGNEKIIDYICEEMKKPDTMF